MEQVKPIYIKLLIAAITIYVIGTSLLISDLCNKVGDLEWTMMRLTGKCSVKH